MKKMKDKIFLGIGAGPIQTGIFISGASNSGFDRIVLADVDEELVEAIKLSRSITVNTAEYDEIIENTYSNIEIYNSSVPEDLEELKKVASQAKVICTALPATSFYKFLIPWLQGAFETAPNFQRFVYAAENSTTAAKELKETIGDFPSTYYLDTVIGKMSKVFNTSDTNQAPLTPCMTKGHLVEAFNTIYTETAPGVEELEFQGLYPKTNLKSFEYAKLYGHNAAHFLMAILASKQGCTNMDQVQNLPEVIETVSFALKNECGTALCQKFKGDDELFTKDGFDQYANELICRMTSKTLSDSIERVIRDLDRKLGWEDRVIGTIRLCLEQGVMPEKLISGALIATKKHFGSDSEKMINGLKNLWQNAPAEEVEKLIQIMFQ